MKEVSGRRKGWTEHGACRHSAGHMYLDGTELSSIPPWIAERASRARLQAQELHHLA